MDLRRSPASAIRSSKLRPHVARQGIVRRGPLLDRLSRSEAPVATVVAPAGYGKTTLLAQWLDDQQSPVAFVSVDDADNDPATLCAYLVAALHQVGAPEPGNVADLGSHLPSSALLTRLITVIESSATPLTVIIDHLESLTNPECLDLLDALAFRLPDGVRLVLSSRVQPRMRTAQLRVERQLLEIGVPDLALDLDQGAELLAGVGVDPTEVDVEDLVERTEGWPAGLYLAALATRVGPTGPDPAAVPSGDSRFLVDYLRSEILDRLSPREAEFLMRTSILDSMSGPLCDAVLDTAGSAGRLEEVEARSLLVVPLDDRREWYRYHRLFGELLRSDLNRREPEVVPLLHARASAWYQANGLLELALGHARAAKDVDRVALLLVDLAQPVWAGGPSRTVLGSMEWLADEDDLDRHPAVAVHGALMYALLGRPARADAWAAAAERSLDLSDLPDGSSIASLLAYQRSFTCREGAEAMRADARSSYAGSSPTSPFRASMLLAEGLSYVLEDDGERARPVLARSVDAAVETGAVPLAAMVLAVLARLAGHVGDWRDATELGRRALRLLEGGAFDEFWSSALVYAWGARIEARSGRIDEARTCLARAARLRPLLTYALPVVSVMALIEIATAYLALGDASGAQAVVRQADGILLQRPSLGHLGAQVDDLRAQLDAAPMGSPGEASLTAAELRLAPFLATHLTMQEIGERLYIARSTVKSQAISVYRKLGVSSRREAVDKLQELGLIVG